MVKVWRLGASLWQAQHSTSPLGQSQNSTLSCEHLVYPADSACQHMTSWPQQNHVESACYKSQSGHLISLIDNCQHNTHMYTSTWCAQQLVKCSLLPAGTNTCSITISQCFRAHHGQCPSTLTSCKQHELQT
jgi:hypothetical protein